MGDVGPAMDSPLGGVPEAGIAPAGFRLPAETRLGPVTLQVAELSRSVGYYRDVLGLRELESGEGWARLGAADGKPLVTLRERRGANPVPRRGRLGLYHFALLVPERPALGALIVHLSSLGIRPGTADHSVSEALYLSDPDGLGIEVYADRPRPEWRYRGRELYMSTEPLDVDALRAAATGGWSGMPAGSSVGHVHLYVGDLTTAAEFYHRGLGFDRTVWSYPGALFLAAGGYHHHLGTNTWAVDAEPAGPEDAQLLEWTVTLPALEGARAAAASMAAAGYRVDGREGDWSAADPWGTSVRVVVATTADPSPPTH